MLLKILFWTGMITIINKTTASASIATKPRHINKIAARFHTTPCNWQGLKVAKPRHIKFWALCPKFYQGFTLMEILLAIFILGIVMATVFGTFTGVISSSRSAEKRAELYQTGRAIMDMISMDIRGMFSQPVEEQGFFFIGLSENVEGISMSRMEFVTTNALSIGQKKASFLSEVGYRVKKTPGENHFSLWRRSQSPPEYPYEEGGKEIPLCKYIEDFRLEFLYKADRVEKLLNMIPQAIIINLVLNLEGEKERFVTMVRPMISAGG